MMAEFMLTDEDVKAIEARAEGQRFPAVTGEEVRALLVAYREVRADVERLRKRTHELQERHDAELSGERQFRKHWGDLLKEANENIVAYSRGEATTPLYASSAFDRAYLAVALDRERTMRALAAELTEALRQSHDDAVEFGGFVCTGECSVSPLLAKARASINLP